MTYCPPDIAVSFSGGPSHCAGWTIPVIPALRLAAKV
jgi:hypothetical protein